MSNNPGFIDVTSANATVMIKAPPVIPNWTTLNHFGSASFKENEITNVETRKGVDGKMAAGWIPSILAGTVTAEANGDAFHTLRRLCLAQVNVRRPIDVSMVVVLPANNQRVTYTGGVVKTSRNLPELSKTQGEVSFSFEFDTATSVDD